MDHKSALKDYLKQQDIELSFNRIIIQGMGGMAQGLFASLLIGTIIKTIGSFLPGTVGEFLVSIAGYTSQAQGAAMGMAIGYAMKCPPYVLYSLATVGIASNTLGGSGGPLAVFVVSCCAILMGKLVSKRTRVDLLVTPSVTIISGVLLAALIAPPIGRAASGLGEIIMWTTNLHPFWIVIPVKYPLVNIRIDGHFQFRANGHNTHTSHKFGCYLRGSRSCWSCWGSSYSRLLRSYDRICCLLIS